MLSDKAWEIAVVLDPPRRPDLSSNAERPQRQALYGVLRGLRELADQLLVLRHTFGQSPGLTEVKLS